MPDNVKPSTIVTIKTPFPSVVRSKLRGPESSTIAERFVAGAIGVLIGMQFPRYGEIHAGAAVALVLTPLWFSVLRRYRGAVWIVLLGLLALLNGLVLSALASTDHHLSSYLTTMNSARLLGLLLCAGALLWVRSRLGDAYMAISVGLGMVITAPLMGGMAVNAWKFALSVPIAVVVLGVTWAIGRRWLDVLALLALSGVSALNDSRSAAAIFVLAAAIVGMQSIHPTGKRTRAWWAVLRLGVLGYIAFLAAQAAILEGYLGDGAMQRTEAQIRMSGSVILGGRPELGASLALIGQQPSGYGSGTLPSLKDILVAKAGMATLGYEPNNGYVERYMFTGGFEVHSVLGDIWLAFGLVGLAWIVFVVVSTFHGAGTQLGSYSMTGLQAFLATRVVWDLFFSPFPSSLITLTLFIAVILVRRDDRPSALLTLPPLIRLR